MSIASPEGISNTPESKFEKIKTLLDKGGDLKEGIKDENGVLQIFMKGDKIIRFDEVYELNITAGLAGKITIENIKINGNNIGIIREGKENPIDKSVFMEAIEKCAKSGAYKTTIEGTNFIKDPDKNLDIKKIGVFNRPSPKILEDQKAGKSAEIMGNSEQQRAELLTLVEEQGIKINEPTQVSNENGNTLENLEKTAGTFEKLFEKFKNIFESIGKGMELMFSGKFKEGMAVIIAGFAGKKKLENNINGNNSNSENTQNNEKLDSNDLKYTAGISMLFLMKGKKNEDYVKSILLQKEIKEKNFNELEKIYKNGEKGISEKLGLKDKGSDKQVFESIKLIIENEKFINGVLGKTNAEWKKGKINDNLLEINKSGGNINDKINKKIENITFSLNPIDAMNQLKGIDMLNISIKDGKISFGDLEERKDLIKDISQESIINIISTNESIKNIDGIQKERLYGLLKDENEKVFIDKLLDYKYNIIGTLSGLFGENFKNDYSKFFEKNGITMKEIIELYMITGGKTNFSEFNTLEKSSLYLKLWKILGKDESFRGEFYDKNIIEGFKNKSIPDDVKIVLGNVFSKISEGFINSGTEAFKEIWEAISIEDKIKIGRVIGILVRAMIKFSPIRVVGITAITSMIINAITTTHLANKYSESQIRKICEETIKQ